MRCCRMCGIVGFIGKGNTSEILLNGLEKLEYRGYDSAGIALLNNKGLSLFKEKGRIAELRKVVTVNDQNQAGIGHTRWATHGVPSKKNAHPHQSMSGRFTLVHNGVIENDKEIKTELLSDYTFLSDTDTEAIVHLIEKFVSSGMEVEEAFTNSLAELKGSYALGLLDKHSPDKIYVAKNKSPLLVGVGTDFNMIASDAMAMIHQTNQIVELMDEEIVILTKEGITIKDKKGNIIERTPYTAEIDTNDIEKGTYSHYMLKEIDEQPSVIRKIIQTYQKENGELNIDKNILLSLNNADRIHIIACGTSYHAGLMGKTYFEKITNIPTEVHIASEFVYNMPLLSKNPLFVFISQSGETADSRACLVQIKKMGYKALTITNVQGSTLSREADFTLLLHAGPEIAVASTKAYTAQVAVLYLLASNAATFKGEELSWNPIHELGIVANSIETVINQKEKIDKITHDLLSETRNAFFIGRGLDYYVSLEGALKLKEISYIQAEGFAGGELKHGTIALIEEGTPVIALNTQRDLNLSIRGNVKEVEARGAKAIVISMENIQDEEDSLTFPTVNHMLTPLVSIIPLQLISYYAALHRNCDVDKPRNLAKSVTVE